MQRLLIEAAVAGGRQVAMLFTGASGSFFAEVDADASRLGISAFAFETAVDVEALRNSTPALGHRRSMRELSVTLVLPLTLLRKTAVRHRLLQARRLVAARQLLADIRASALVCSEDGISAELAIITGARQLGIPIIDVPFGFGSIYEIEANLARKEEDGTLILPIGRNAVLMRRVAPQWVKQGRFAGAVMFPPELILAMESLGITLRDAWIIHGGLSDILCVDTKVGLRQYLREGIPTQKLRETGSPYCDVMVRALADDLAATAALRAPKRIEREVTRILVSWPASYHATYPGKNEFPTYEEMTRAVFSMMSALPDCRVTVSLHPACSEDTAVMLRDLGVHLATDYLLELIPRHDVFVTYFSSTIRWALAAGKPVVNYDAYALGLKTFDEAPGFINAATFADFKSKLTELVSSEAEFARVAAAQIEVADDWGILDGKCTERIFAEIDRLVAARTPRRKGAPP